MKFGVADYGMNVWDGGFYDLQTRLEELKGIGFDGIERLEASGSSDAVYQAAKFHRAGMDFATVRGLRENNTLEWSCAFGRKYVWLCPGPADRSVDFETFCRRARKYVKVAESMNLSAALHNHLGSRVENEKELDDFMTACPGAKLLLDIGHLHGAGGDPVAAILKYADRLAAIHFKDIEIKDLSKGLDKWYERLRFCELGAGNAGVDWKGCVAALKKIGYDGWIFVEHDTHMAEPVGELRISLELLKKEFGVKK